jgi:uncharacterized protein (TIGR00369 family)
VGLFGLELVTATPTGSSVRIPHHPNVLRPGGTVAGPVMFAAADVATYAIVLAASQDPAAATVELGLKFLRPAGDLPLLARAEVLRLGRRLCSVAVRIAPEAAPERLVAHASTTWALSG